MFYYGDTIKSGSGVGNSSVVDIPLSTQDLTEEFRNITGEGHHAIAMIGSKDLSMSQIKIYVNLDNLKLNHYLSSIKPLL